MQFYIKLQISHLVTAFLTYRICFPDYDNVDAWKLIMNLISSASLLRHSHASFEQARRKLLRTSPRESRATRAVFRARILIFGEFQRHFCEGREASVKEHGCHRMETEGGGGYRRRRGVVGWGGWRKRRESSIGLHATCSTAGMRSTRARCDIA